MSNPATVPSKAIDPRKFQDPDWTAKGERRAAVGLKTLATLWFNTGTLCNLTCRSCYIESSPTNDRLAYITEADVVPYLDEIARDGLATTEIAFTGGEPFMNPHLCAILEETLKRGFQALVLTNAMRPMMKMAESLLALRRRFGGRLVIRVSIDHYPPTLHELERGKNSWSGSPPTASPHASPAAPAGASPRPRCAKATPASSPGSGSRSTRAIRPASCCSPRWTRARTCPRSPRPAGASSASIPTR
jgi:hypothetical protein